MTDPTTQSNYSQIATEHVHFDWELDFEAKIIAGSATHRLLVKEDNVQEAIFDTSELDLSDVRIGGKSATFDLKAKHEVMGSALHVELPSGLRSGQHVDLVIHYKTTKGCTALQWLDKAQTQGKQFSFLFSQCQPIYARAIAPLQDSPSVKIKYSAKVISVLPVLLSAIRQSPPSSGPPHNGKVIGKEPVTYTYDQPVPIPSYLIAIAAGNLHYEAFAPLEDKRWTCGLWAEPELINKAYWEFSEDTARFLAAEEEVVVPYKFGVYDLLVLPPSFPYGGMENACLTFLTPSMRSCLRWASAVVDHFLALLAGDRSLVDVVVHELTHSWFGNGVTHANASHFWLNEGWTTYMERVLQEILYTPAHRGFSYIIGSKALKSSLAEFEKKPKYQRLVIDFEPGEDPDNAYSSIAYEKGANLLLHIERKLGGLKTFLPYVRDYVGTYIGKSITTQQWKEHLYAYWANPEKGGGPEKIEALDSINWHAWFHGEGMMLPVEMEYDLTLAQQAYALAARWDASRSVTDISHLKFKEEDLAGFNSNQIIVFLERLQSYSQLPLAHVQLLASLYKVSKTPNAEIRFRFYELTLTDVESESAHAYAAEAVNWIVGAGEEEGLIVGRMKFCRPIFRTVGKVNHDLAVKTWEENQEGFHPVARRLIEKDLGIKN